MESTVVSVRDRQARSLGKALGAINAMLIAIDKVKPACAADQDRAKPSGPPDAKA